MEPNVAELPLYRSVTKTMLMMGAPKLVVVWNMVIAGIFIVDLKFYPILILSFIVHVLAVYFAKKDEQFAECIKIYLQKSKYYCT